MRAPFTKAPQRPARPISTSPMPVWHQWTKVNLEKVKWSQFQALIQLPSRLFVLKITPPLSTTYNLKHLIEHHQSLNLQHLMTVKSACNAMVQQKKQKSKTVGYIQWGSVSTRIPSNEATWKTWTKCENTPKIKAVGIKISHRRQLPHTIMSLYP